RGPDRDQDEKTDDAEGDSGHQSARGRRSETGPTSCGTPLGVLRLQIDERGRLFLALEGYELPRVAASQKSTRELVVQRMAGLVRAESANDGMAQQVEIADRVEHLVLHELVLVAQTVRVEHTKFVHHDRVVQTAAKAEALSTHGLHVLHEAERTC